MSERSGFLDEAGPDGDPQACLSAADKLLAAGEDALAAAALDRAWGLRPEDPSITARRAALLDALSVTALGLHFLYIPAGSFYMGSEQGESDERPVHRRRLEAFWMAEVPLSWASYCRLQDWEMPPHGVPKDLGVLTRYARIQSLSGNKLRHLYCLRPGESSGLSVDGTDCGDAKPLVTISAEEADRFAAAISGEGGRFFLPSEAQWEKAARGGLIGARHAWGDAPPSPERCDFGRFDAFAIGESKALPPNGYGLYAVCGGVWEWTADHYDALAYARGEIDPAASERVLRGGSWADCAEAVTVSYRMSSSLWFSPTIGLRLAADFSSASTTAR